MKLYNVIVFNQLKQGATEESALSSLQKNLKLSSEKSKKLLSSERTTVKKNIEEEMAMKYKATIEKCGLFCKVIQSDEIEDTPSPAEDTLAPSDAQTENTLELVEKEELPKSQEPESSAEQSDIYKAPESLASNRVFCRQCGTSMNVDEQSCPSCGAKVEFSGRSKITTGFLAFFLGAFGIHRFYLKQWWGIFYIPGALFGISGLVSLIEAIYFWCMSKSSWDERYGHLPHASGLVIALITIFPIIFIVGILAAIALPAYQDYTHRAKITEGIIQLDDTSQKVEEFILRTNFVPNTKLDANLQGLSPNNEALSDIDIIEGGRIMGTFNPLIKDGEAFTIVYAPTVKNNSVSWSCSAGTMPDKYRPARCRGGSDQYTSVIDKTSLKKYMQSPDSNVRIKVPSSWIPNVFENEDASIRAGNIYSESYVLLIEEYLSDLPGHTLKSYADGSASYYLETLDSQLINQTEARNSHFSGIIYEIDANVDGIAIRYLIGYYFSHEKAYQVMTWSLASRFEKNKHDMRNVINSFETF